MNKKTLEKYITLPSGGQAARCQANNRKGQQCARPAREGYNVCDKHGAGTRKREEAGNKKPPGRPVTHGMYSKEGQISIEGVTQELLELKTNLDNTDGPLATLHATLTYLLRMSDEMKDKGNALVEYMGWLEEQAGKAMADRDYGVARIHNMDIRTAARVQAEIGGWLDRLRDCAVQIQAVVKSRAETKVKMAETKAIEQFIILSTAQRNIIWEMLTPEQLDVFEDRLKREVFGPNRIEMPKREKHEA